MATILKDSGLVVRKIELSNGDLYVTTFTENTTGNKWGCVTQTFVPKRG
jgi:hypothetical protein